MKSYQLFEKLLSETGLNNQFLSNFFKFPPQSLSTDFPDLGRLMSLDPMDYVSQAFRWRNTPEGVDFWYLVNASWIDLFKRGLSFDEAKSRIRSIQNLVVGSPIQARCRVL